MNYMNLFVMDRVYSYIFHILSEYCDYDMFVNANIGFETLRCLEKVPTIFSQMVEFVKSHLQQIQDIDFGRPLICLLMLVGGDIQCLSNF